MPSGLRELTVLDATRGLSFPAIVQYPTAASGDPTVIGPYAIPSTRDAPLAEGQFPLVLLSHGSGGWHLLYRSISTHLANNGYVVVAPEHPGNNRRDNMLVGTDENSIRRPYHASLTLDAVLADSEFRGHIAEHAIGGIGHSIGAYTMLALAGGEPWSKEALQLSVHRDPRVRAAVLMAPATAWYQPPDALRHVHIPLMLIAGEKDHFTPLWHSELVRDGVPDRARAELRVIANAGHYSFLTPFPASMRSPTFPPSTDPEGFDRDQFHTELPEMVLAFFNAQLGHATG
jgi:predicted dienelactone hydrolase